MSNVLVNVFPRLVKRPEDTHDAIQRDLHGYDMHMEHIQDFSEKHFDALHRIDLDATQHPDTLYESAMERIETLGYSIHCKAVTPLILDPPESGFRGICHCLPYLFTPAHRFGIIAGVTDQDIIKFFATTQLQDGEPRREMSMWDRHCPVTFLSDGTLSQSSVLTFPVAYRVRNDTSSVNEQNTKK